jgi:hypothetical protein
MSSSRKTTNRSPKSCSRTNSPDVSQVPRGTPPAGLADRCRITSNLQDRLERITLCANPAYLIRLAERSSTYRDLIRRYSNDSML